MVVLTGSIAANVAGIMLLLWAALLVGLGWTALMFTAIARRHG